MVDVLDVENLLVDCVRDMRERVVSDSRDV